MRADIKGGKKFHTCRLISFYLFFNSEEANNQLGSASLKKDEEQISQTCQEHQFKKNVSIYMRQNTAISKGQSSFKQSSGCRVQLILRIA